jgi:hypothetical protein
MSVKGVVPSMVQRLCLVLSVVFIVAVPFGVCLGQAAYQGD